MVSGLTGFEVPAAFYMPKGGVARNLNPKLRADVSSKLPAANLLPIESIYLWRAWKKKLIGLHAKRLHGL